MTSYDFHEFVGTVVALVVFAVRRMPHVQRFAVVHRCDDVPGGAAVGHQVERGEHACDMERFVIGGGIRRAEAEPLCRHAHDGEDGERVHLHAANAVGDRVRVVVAVAVRHCQAIVEEADMEFSRFEHACDVAVIVGGHEAGRGVRMPPGADEVRAVLRLQEGHESHLPHAHFPPPAVLPVIVMHCDTLSLRGAQRRSNLGPVRPEWLEIASSLRLSQ